MDNNDCAEFINPPSTKSLHVSVRTPTCARLDGRPDCGRENDPQGSQHLHRSFRQYGPCKKFEFADSRTECKGIIIWTGFSRTFEFEELRTCLLYQRMSCTDFPSRCC